MRFRPNAAVLLPIVIAAAPALAGPLDYNGRSVYLGADYADTTLTVKNSGIGSLAIGHYGSDFVDLRAGWRLLNAANLEIHYGAPAASASGSHVHQTAYVGGFVVPTATLASAVELSLPFGYSRRRLRAADGGSATLSGVSFGARLDLPLGHYWPALQGFRIGGGGMLYDSESRARYYGFEGGLRYDFGF